ncbi:hypothetical protein ACEQ8H_001996 [Pleosporales sp. CAS-2024a]
MNPHQQNKVDISKLSPDEAKLFRLYGKLPNKKDLLQNKLKERKYFDSGDYALSKAGKAGDVGVTQVGREHPNPEKIPHIAPQTPNNLTPVNSLGQENKAGSPVKEHPFMHRETSLNRETSASDFDDEPQTQDAQVHA